MEPETRKEEGTVFGKWPCMPLRYKRGRQKREDKPLTLQTPEVPFHRSPR